MLARRATFMLFMLAGTQNRRHCVSCVCVYVGNARYLFAPLWLLLQAGHADHVHYRFGGVLFCILVLMLLLRCCGCHSNIPIICCGPSMEWVYIAGR